MQSIPRQTQRIILSTTRTLRSAGTSYQQHVSRPLPWTCQDCRTKLEAGKRNDASKILSRRNAFTTITRRKDSQERSHSASLSAHKPNGKGDVSEKMSKLVDAMLARATVAKHQIDAYTETDYTHIDALRKEIERQEKNIESCNSTVNSAKVHYQGEISKQTGAQKEIVSLLERKSSWLPADLERYMSLVRSEHVNDQSVHAAKLSLETSERDLEEARALLQKLVGQVYHEEYIWNNFIKRNSTWVTVGLMGVNILLLLAQILVFEPHRRKKIIKDLREALDEKTLSAAPSVFTPNLPQQAGFVTPPLDVHVDEGRSALRTSSIDASTQTLEAIASSEELGPGQLLPEEAVYFSTPTQNTEREPARIWKRRDGLAAYQSAFWDLFSDRLIEMKQLDATTLALRGVVAGAAVAGLMISLLRHFGINA